MANVKLFGRKVGFVLAIAGAAVVGGATTALVTAAIPSSSDGQIHGCYRNSGNILNPQGSLRVIDSEASQTCTAQETSLNWGTKDTVQAYGNIKVADDGTGSSPTVELMPNSWKINAVYLSSQSPADGVCVDFDSSVNPMQVFLNGSTNFTATSFNSELRNLGGASEEAVGAHCQAGADLLLTHTALSGSTVLFLRAY